MAASMAAWTLSLVSSSLFVAGFECPMFADVVQPGVAEHLKGPQWFNTMEGVWYEVAGADATQPKFCTCSQYNISIGEDGNITHSDNRFDSFCGFQFPQLHFKGNFDPTTPGKYHEAFAYDTTTPNYIVDYGTFPRTTNTYAILFTCNPTIHFYAIQVLTRDAIVDGGALDSVLKALGNHSKMGDVDMLRVTHIPQDTKDCKRNTESVLV